MQLKTFLLAAVLSFAPLCGFAKDPTAEAKTERPDIAVAIVTADGKLREYSKEVASLEIIVGADGKILYVHMILMTDNIKDTHCWYNFNNLVSFEYRFLAITGKSKVAIKQADRLAVQQESGIVTKIPVVGVDDYR